MKKILLVLVLWAHVALASFNVYEFDDEQQRVRFYALINELRCPQCQNNNLADSNSPLATDIKNYVFDEVVKGKSDEEIKNFLVARYGEFVLYNPRNHWLWIIPLLLTLGGSVIVFAVLRQKNTASLTIIDKEDYSDLPKMEDLIKEYEQSRRRK